MNVLDLFSGIGGFSLGLERAGFKTVAFCENDINCQKVLKKHWPNIPIFEDVINLKARDIKESIDVICGGFPCQDISVAGKKRGINADRSGLWKEFHRIIKEVSPGYVIIENVANLRNLGLARVIKDLWKIGYDCEWHIISARSIGACHLRERIWIIAYPNIEGFQRRVCPSGEVGPQAQTCTSVIQSSNSNMPRLWRSFATEEAKFKWWTEATSYLDNWWKVESDICRVADGISSRMDERARKERIKQLGNSLVPFIPELIGKMIMDYEKNEI